MKAEYIDHMGSDLTVVNAARVSFDKESAYSVGPEGEQSLLQSDVRLIRYLASNGHWTPFSHGTITLRETVPIFVARQRFKHVVGFSYNEVSRRYVDSPPAFFSPSSWRGRPEGSLKQGSGEPVDDQHYHKIRYDEFLNTIEGYYQDLIDEGVCPEQARMVLPQSMYTSYYVTGTLYAWARAFNLRSESHAQVEIQELAADWDHIIRARFPISWKGLTNVS